MVGCAPRKQTSGEKRDKNGENVGKFEVSSAAIINRHGQNLRPLHAVQIKHPQVIEQLRAVVAAAEGI